MITKEQAIEIVEKFKFFQGQRTGRELWAEKPKAVQDEDIENFDKDCYRLLEYLQGATPQYFWVIVGTPGFCELVKYEVEGLEYFRGELTCITGYSVKTGSYAVISDHELGKTAFFTEAAAEQAIKKQ